MNHIHLRQSVDTAICTRRELAANFISIRYIEFLENQWYCIHKLEQWALHTKIANSGTTQNPLIVPITILDENQNKLRHNYDAIMETDLLDFYKPSFAEQDATAAFATSSMDWVASI
jgi:hypothetical protein